MRRTLRSGSERSCNPKHDFEELIEEAFKLTNEAEFEICLRDESRVKKVLCDGNRVKEFRALTIFQKEVGEPMW